MTTPHAATLPALASHYLGQYLSRIRHCVGLLSEEEVWWRPAPGANTIGNLMLSKLIAQVAEETRSAARRIRATAAPNSPPTGACPRAIFWTGSPAWSIAPAG